MKSIALTLVFHLCDQTKTHYVGVLSQLSCEDVILSVKMMEFQVAMIFLVLVTSLYKNFIVILMGVNLIRSTYENIDNCRYAKGLY